MKPPKATGCFILIASTTENHDGKKILANEMVRKRIEAKAWGLWRNTPHKTEIKKGDVLLIYTAGYGGAKFVAHATAGDISFRPISYHADGDALTDHPVAVLDLQEPQWFDIPLPISTIKDKLDFVPKGTNKWGCVLQRGVKRISREDAMLILNAAKNGEYPSSDSY